mmetsp:Transcript_4240/g.4752  ORF Transcript_4240/g.4752 Transcript_4240/m.4752 type:complete len:104 (+) Transcript_4240:296-607(+)
MLAISHLTMKITASRLSVFVDVCVGVGVGVASAAGGDHSGHRLRSITDQHQNQRTRCILQDGSPDMETGNGGGAVTTGADMSGSGGSHDGKKEEETLIQKGDL